MSSRTVKCKQNFFFSPYLGMQEVQRNRQQNAVEGLHPIGKTPRCHLQKSQIDVAEEGIGKKSSFIGKTCRNFAGRRNQIEHDEYDIFQVYRQQFVMFHSWKGNKFTTTYILFYISTFFC